MSDRAPGAWGLLGEGMRLGGILGLVIPWFPDDRSGMESSDRTWSFLLGWYATMAVVLALSALFVKRAEDGRWPCWLFGGHSCGEVWRGRFICRRCKRVYGSYQGGVAP